LEDILNLSKKKIEVVYLGVNNIFLKNNCENNLINLFNYNERYILSVMSCVKYHNIINILKAFKLLIDDLKIDIKLVLVLQILDKKYFLEIEKFIRSNHMEKQIQIFSNLNINQLPKLYKNAELYVFTSYCEVFGLTSLEAMAKETPVVISNRSALPEVNGDAVLYFNPDEVSEIESCLKKIMLDQNLKRFLIDSGKVQYKKFDSKENVKRTIDIIEKVV